MLSKDISVVVQGPIYEEATFRCLKSIRSSLPDSTVILSTWEGVVLSGLESLYDEVVLSEDPGPTLQMRRGSGAQEEIKLSNVNRQIRSSINGLLRVKTKYAIKIRSDFALIHDCFSNYFHKYENYNCRYKCVRKRILLYNLYSRNPNIKRCPYPYHYSDIAMFGLADDLLDLWSIPECADDDFINGEYGLWARYSPEQYVWLSYLRKHKEIECEQFDSNDRHVVAASSDYMLNNVVLLNDKQFGLQAINKAVLEHHAWTCYSHSDWRALYYYRFSGRISVGYIWLKIKESFLPNAAYAAWRKIVKAVGCLIFNKKLRRKFRMLCKC